jgi:hypothetical protein
MVQREQAAETPSDDEAAPSAKADTHIEYADRTGDETVANDIRCII